MNPLYPAAIALAAAWANAGRTGRRAQIPAMPGAIVASKTQPGVLYRGGADDKFKLRYKRARVDPHVLRVKLQRRRDTGQATGGERSRLEAFIRHDVLTGGPGVIVFEQVDNETGALKRRPRLIDYWVAPANYPLMFVAKTVKSSTWSRKSAPPPRLRLEPVEPPEPAWKPERLPIGRHREHESKAEREAYLYIQQARAAANAMKAQGHAWNTRHVNNWLRTRSGALRRNSNRMPVGKYPSWTAYEQAQRKAGKKLSEGFVEWRDRTG